jgi:dolichyl-phosphate beta-glucosyltransferase
MLNTIMIKLCGLVLGSPLKDTQCGFKIWSRQAAQVVFPSQHLERWAFDLEVLFLSFKHLVPVSEMAVCWQDVEGSHLNVVDASSQMIRDMLLIRILYFLGVWRVND